MAPALRPLARKWRFALSGTLTALLLFTIPLLSPPLDSDALWDSWMPRYGPLSSSIEPPLIEQLGLAAFLRTVQEDEESQGSIRMEEYVVPPEFGIGTKANLSSTDFSRLVVGRGFQYIDLPVSTILPRPTSLTHSNDEPKHEQEGAAFNPTILKMPEGMRKGWEYIVVARGPRVVRKDMWVSQSNRWALEHGLIAFPATLDPQTHQFQPSLSVSRPSFLPIVTEQNNTSCGYWSFPFGAEDPRLYWTDEGRPAMSLSMNARQKGEEREGGRCRSVGWVGDLRDVWEELRGAMESVDESLAMPWSEVEEKQVVKELWHDQRMANMEKNWMGFFPGPHKNSIPHTNGNTSNTNRSTLPNFHYSLIPAKVLVPPLDDKPTTSDIPDDKESLTYSFLPANTSNPPQTDPAHCISRRFKDEIQNIHRIHQATPLYRFTLCGRRECVPDVGNTVMLGLGQAKWVYNGGQRYWRFFVLWNVTEPFDLVAVGPLIRWYGTLDAEVVYAMSLVFDPTTTSRNTHSTTAVSVWRQSKETKKNTQSLSVYGPTHGFLDDDVHVTLGLRDNEMGSVVMSGSEVLLGMEMCL